MMKKLVELSISAIGIVLVCLATIALQVYIPATHGYFNLGETMVYTFALLFGPRVGLIAGGIGSALADLLTGYVIYAPGTLVIKAIEGFLVGILSRFLIRYGKRVWKPLSIVLGISIALSLSYIGVSYYSEPSETSIGLPYLGYKTFIIVIPPTFWIAVSLIIASFIVYYGLRIDPKIGVIVFSIIVGGLEMVLGYYLYEQFILGYFALAEVPFNICQMLIGLSVAVPLYRSLENKIRYFK